MFDDYRHPLQIWVVSVALKGQTAKNLSRLLSIGNIQRENLQKGLSRLRVKLNECIFWERKMRKEWYQKEGNGR